MDILKQFLKYVSFDTTSNSKIEEVPTTKGQIMLARAIADDLKKMGVETYFDEENCYLYGVLKGNDDIPKIGFMSHLDTSEDAKGKDIKTNIIENYDGSDIKLNEEIISKVEIFPDLKNHVGHTLITTDGTTLLGADDKAGIVEILSMLEYFVNNNIEHGDIYVCFTPDEEIGLGLQKFDITKFPVHYAYTVDGSTVGEISYENFNAASAEIEILGTSSHCGTAKGLMVNAILLANEFNSMLPNEIPANTDGREGFYHLETLEGNVSCTKMKYLIRDFDKENFLNRINEMLKIAEFLNNKYGERISYNITHSYYNMAELIKNDMHLVNNVKNAMIKANIKPIIKPIRGGTDGADLSYMGILCPNIGTGAHNMHSVYEYIALEDMQKTSEILTNIVLEYAGYKRVRKIK